ncbi:MAG: flagellar hook-basal body complex protein [Tagaea sp.]|nr:flagellar hook-basal body complex protein [Tagaea sp.]
MATVAMNSAISGLNAFQTAINYISDNVANSQTIGFKRIDSNFSSYVSASSQRFFNPGGATNRPDFVNSLQGTIIQDSSPTSIAIAGAGWLPVEDGATSASGFTGNNVRQFTRRGDFSLDQNSFMVNGAGKYLFARSVPRPTTAVPNPQPNQGALVPVQINTSQLPALASANAAYAANIPSNAAANTVFNGGTITITDANGAARPAAVTWFNRSALGGTGTLPAVTASTANGTNTVAASAAGTAPQWRAVVTLPTSSANGNESVVLDFSFGTTTTTAGLLTGITVAGTTAPGTQLTAAVTAGTGRVVLSYGAPSLTAPPPAQTINLEFGAPDATAGQPSDLNVAGGTTQFGGTSISLSNITADGYSAGSYNGLSIDTNGNVFSTYTNGQRLRQFQLALGTFNNADGLVRQNGESFLDSPAAGFIGYQAALTGQAGGVNPNALENSNTDIGQEFTKMIVAQRSYSANARIITTADEMLQEVVNLKR